jgi:hypothetical protein
MRRAAGAHIIFGVDFKKIDMGKRVARSYASAIGGEYVAIVSGL